MLPPGMHPSMALSPSSNIPEELAGRFRVGRYSAEERMQRIGRYKQKREMRNFTKKIKVRKIVFLVLLSVCVWVVEGVSWWLKLTG